VAAIGRLADCNVSAPERAGSDRANASRTPAALDIEGRSKMNKAQLQRAVAGAGG
jgi:hypothetical protein